MQRSGIAVRCSALIDCAELIFNQALLLVRSSRPLLRPKQAIEPKGAIYLTELRMLASLFLRGRAAKRSMRIRQAFHYELIARQT
jgi:hypothetical protein